MQHLSIYDIAELSGKSRISVHRLPFLKEFEVKNIPTTEKGRPMKFYKKEVLELIRPDIFSNDAKPIQKSEKIRKHRDDHNLPREPRRLSPDQRIALDKEICSRAKSDYIQQALKNNVRESVRLVCAEYCRNNGVPAGFENYEQMTNYYYKFRIKRKDGVNVGYYYKEHWEELWTAQNDLRTLNARMPHTKYEYLELFENLKIAGNGFGANCLWAIDATQLDMWVNIDGEPTQTRFFMIIDVLTGYPVWLEQIESESTETAISAIIQAVKRYGIPRFGIIADNGRAFTSEAFKGFVRNMYSDSQLKEIRESSWIQKVFGQDDVVKFPNPKMPDYFGKAKLERTFDEINRLFPTRFYPRNVLAGRESREVSYELGTTPTKARKTAPNVVEVWDRLILWVQNELVENSVGSSLALLRKRGMRPTRKNAFLYYGGEKQSNKIEVNEENAPLFIYYRAPREMKHEVKISNYGIVNFTHDNMQYRFMNEEIFSFGMINKKVVIIPSPTSKDEVYVFLKHNPKHFDERVKEADSVAYLGKAYSQSINNEESLNRIYKRSTAQKTIVKTINQELELTKVVPRVSEPNYMKESLVEKSLVEATIIDDKKEIKYLKVEVQQTKELPKAKVEKPKFSFK